MDYIDICNIIVATVYIGGLIVTLIREARHV